MAKRKRNVIVGETRVCSDEFGVTTLLVHNEGRHVHRRTPCAECPWRMDVPTGVFPAQAFRESAPTAYDGAFGTFSCHMQKTSAPSTCAGFLLRHSENNVGVRLSQGRERIDIETVSDGGLPVYPSYREMAVANGVAADDPVLDNVRANDDTWDRQAGKWRGREEQ